MKRALIIGINGQDGQYLSEILSRHHYDVHGIDRPRSLLMSRRASRMPTTLHYGDLTDFGSLYRVVKDLAPDEVYNLGAQSQVSLSFQIPEATSDTTGLGVTRVLEALRMSGSKARFYQAGSSELFGDTTISPQNEKTPFSPRNPYASSKAYGFHMTRNYRESYGMFAVNGILFNHESPLRDETFVTRKITMSIARIVAGTQDCLSLGNLDAKRDWGYAKEFMEGVWLMMQQDTPDDYVLATGKRHSVREFLELCLTEAGIAWTKEGLGDDEVYRDGTGRVIVRIDQQFKRPSMAKEHFIGDAGKAKKILGWEAKTTLHELAVIMMRADAERVGLRR
jgi:GDPmannose 4,6-dehydratase